MRKAYALLLAIVALGIILGTVIVSSEMPSVPSTGSTEQSKALAFIENVLPIDSSQYNITFRPPFSSNLSNPD